MTRKSTHLKWAGATIAVLALVGAVSVYATSDGALWIGALVGVIALGLWGDTVVGIAILGVGAVVDGVAFAVRRVVASRRVRRGAVPAEAPSAPRIERAQLLRR